MTGIQIYRATGDRWPDLEKLFGEKGAYAGCWCMFWRLERAEFKRLKGERNRAILRSMCETGPAPGLLAYEDGQAMAWCAIGPRESFRALDNSRILKRVDNHPAWSIPCFFVAKSYRQQGLMRVLIEGAVDYAQRQGAEIVEGYPIDLDTPQLSGQRLTSYAGYMGIASAFRENGFVEVGRASETQLIMRRML
jgi:GNAT superfamily N-acetyltransferase